MKINYKIYIILITLSCLSSLRGDNHTNFEKAKKNKEMALMFFEKLLIENKGVALFSGTKVSHSPVKILATIFTFL